MLVINDIHDQRLVEILTTGGIAVIRTDTLYGIVASAHDESAVERVYEAKGRDPHKSSIVLLDRPESSFGHTEELSGDIDLFHEQPTSFLIDAEEAPRYLLRENIQLAYRVPSNNDLQRLLSKTGPLIAPSANPQGESPARTIPAAIAYFGDLVDVYVDGGEVPSDMPPSRVVRVRPDGSLEQIR
ncbi:MAG: Sua5/YciO/YrdC/YwlC family protein [Candidatus Saccharimonadales bacterium]